MYCWGDGGEGWHDAVPLPNSAVDNFNVVSVSTFDMFGDAECANRFFSTVHELLADGGVLIATTVDPNMLMMKSHQRLRSSQQEKGDQEANKHDMSIAISEAAQVCTRFSPSRSPTELQPKAPQVVAFSHCYRP
jgi:hypothetical protein